MTTVAPPPPPLPPLPAVTALPAVTVSAPPASILALALGARLEALLMAQDGKGGFQVQTPLGPLNLQAPFSLPPSASLTFGVQALQPQVLLQLLTVNGRPAPAALAQFQAHGQEQAPTQGQGVAGKPSGLVAGTQPQAGGPAAASGPGGLPFVSLTTGTTMNATLLRPAVGLAEAGMRPEAQPAAQAALAAARTALAAAKSQLSGMVDTALGLARGTQTPQTPAQTPSAPATQAAPVRTIPLPAGTQLNVTLVSVQAPAAGGEAPPPTPPAGGNPVLARGVVLAGTVTGTTPTGQPVIQTPAGPLVLETRQPVPQGASVTLQIKAPPPPLAASASATLPPGVNPAADATWLALAEAIEALQQDNPAIAQQVLSGPIARPDSRLGAGMMFFLAAVRGGDLKGWLGDGALRAIERARPGLAGRLRDDFEVRGKRSEEVSTDGWKTVAIPLHDGSAISQMKLMTRDHPEEETPEAKGGGGTRFVVEVDLSQTGRVQLDGLVFKKNKRLDLILRTEGPLPAGMRDDIRALFREAADLTGLQGGVTFQANPPHFVEPAPPLDPAAHRGVVV